MLHITHIQVLSKSVADAFAYYGDPTTTETERFVRNFDRLFDYLNVRSLTDWKSKKKPDLKPYSSPSDSRLKVLLRHTPVPFNMLVAPVILFLTLTVVKGQFSGISQ